MPDTSKVWLLQITMYVVHRRWKPDPGSRLYWNQMCPTKHVLPYHWTSLTIPFPLLLFSAAPQPAAPSPLYLPSWWYSPVLVWVAGEQSPRASMTLDSISFWQIFSPSRSYHRAFVWTQCNTLGWKHFAGQTDLRCHRGAAYVLMSTLSWKCPLFDQQKKIKNHYAVQRSRRFEQERSSNVQHVGRSKSSDNSAARPGGLLNNSGGKSLC